MIVKKWTAAIIGCLLAANGLFAQKTIDNKDKNALLSQAHAFFDAHQYSAAQQNFLLIAENPQFALSTRIDAQFYVAVTALRLFNGDAEMLITQFIEKYPESPHIYRAYFEYANFLFRNQNFEKALQFYEKVDIARFGNRDLSEYFYKLAYSYFKTNELQKAKQLFRETKDSKSVYAENALYYYSYLEYLDKNYDAALAGFEKLAIDTAGIFATVVPPYIVQIYYQQQQYEKALTYALEVEPTVNPSQLPDVYKVIASAYYKTLQYDKSLPYYEKYMQAVQNPTVQDYYEIGFLYYNFGQYAKAIENLEQVTGKNDTLSQNAYYHLGLSYLQMGAKEKARNAFMAAAEFSVFPDIQESAAFNYAKLTYELALAPFNEAITAMNNFIAQFPNSKRKDEAHALLVKIFMTSRNYKDALQSLDNISNLSSDLQMAYQQIAYYRGLELFNNLEYEEARNMFAASLRFAQYDRKIAAMSVYWKAESFFKQGDLDNARKSFNEFITMPGSYNTAEYARAHYNLGYIYFAQHAYNTALQWFRKYLDIASDRKSDFYTDAAIRVGDSYFMNKDFAQAIKYYEIAKNAGNFDREYVLFQLAFNYGLLGKQQEKIAILNTLIETYPQSQYYVDALFETAEAYYKLDNIPQALALYNTIVDTYPTSSYYKKSLLQIALSAYNAAQYDNALAMYKKIVDLFPGSPEAQTAMNMIRNIYKKQSDIDSYADYVKQIGGYADVSEAKLDSLSFEVAQELYLDGNCTKAIPLFTNYINRYTEGFFLLYAHFYRGTCLFNSNAESDALADFLFVLRTQNEFTETALLNASYILFTQDRFDEALPLLVRLEKEAEVKQNLEFARKSLISIYAQQQNYTALIPVAEKYLLNEKIYPEEKRWAQMLTAQALQATGDTTRALQLFKKIALAPETREGAESRFAIIDYYFTRGNYDQSEKEILDFLEIGSPYAYWLGRAYLTWAQIFMNRDEIFQARYTLQSILQYYAITTDGIINSANDMLNALAALEIQKNATPEPEVVVPMGNNPELFQ
ncbi:MAG: tetratricopeptide repeat protein [Bacteroidales bacterium]|jgi:tetratricopeptide (TPR) repeat protein|nr:tetratricopeptide repeat protein [Bacteroidales bacterium]